MFDYGILQDAGKVSAEIAKLHAETEFEKYRVIQDRLFMSDFDKYMLELEENTKVTKKWCATGTPPHELIIDLGEEVAVSCETYTGVRYSSTYL